MAELKPCPLCGNKAIVTKLGGTNPIYNVACGRDDDITATCGLVLFGGSADKRKDMVAKWNQREKADG